MNEDTQEAVIVARTEDRPDSARPSRRSRRDEPSARKLLAARRYASGEAKSAGAALVGAGYSPNTAINPRANNLGRVELVRVDLEHNPAPVDPSRMYHDGLATLHALATRGESESVKGASADRLVNHLKDTGAALGENEITAADRYEAWRDMRQATRRGVRAGVRLMARYGLAHALDVLAAHEEIEAAREFRRRPAATPEPPARIYRAGPAE